MVECKSFYQELLKNKIEFFCGVPDSLLKNICSYIDDNVLSSDHVITANEGNAIGLASGYHMATGKVPLVYLQNSGLGNIINPLLSLADKEVYSVPMLLMIGWRGEPGLKDEPQHVKQGRVQMATLEAMDVPYMILDDDVKDIAQFLSEAVSRTREASTPLAIVVKKGVFGSYKRQNEGPSSFLELSREGAIDLILRQLGENDVVVSTTGKPSREVYETREKLGHVQRDFLTVGSMGHCSMIAFGVAKNSNKNVVCIDGDGALIMHMGALSTIGVSNQTNFKHIVLNNGAHDSVGGQPTVAFDISFPQIAKACGYRFAKSVDSKSTFYSKWETFMKTEGPCLLEIKVALGSRSDLGRPKSTPLENRYNFEKFLRT